MFLPQATGANRNACSALRSTVLMLEEKAQYFAAGVRSSGIGVRAFVASAAPCVSGAMDDPLLDDRFTVSVAVSDTRVFAPACAVPLFAALERRGCIHRRSGTLCSACGMCDQIVAVLGMYRAVVIAVKDDHRRRAPWRRILVAFAPSPLRSLASHGCKGRREVESRAVREARMNTHGCVNVRIGH